MALQAMDLILKDIEHFEASLRASEDVGEKRFSFFVSLTTAIVGGLVALLTSEKISPSFAAMVIELSLIALLAIGMMTYLRMLQRNRMTDEHKRTLKYLRGLFVQMSPELEAANYRVPTSASRSTLGRWARGGYAETVGLIEGLLVTILLYRNAALPAGWAVAMGAIVAAALYLVATVRGGKNDVYFRAGAGAVIVDDNDRVLVLHRSGSAPNDGWQFPQGGLLEDEGPLAAVKREIEEETAIAPKALELLDSYPEPLVYELPAAMMKPKTGNGQVQYWFLFRLRNAPQSLQPPSGEFQAAAWRTFEEAVAGATTFRQPIYRRLQQRFAPRLHRPGQQPQKVQVVRFTVSEEAV